MCNHPEIHMVVIDDRYVFSECNFCHQLMMRVQEDQNDPLYTFVPAHQCECCNEWFSNEPILYPNPESRYAKAKFCSDECADEAVDQVRCAEYEDRREYEVWGDDYDSWYR